MAAFATVAELEAFMGTSGLGARGTAILDYASAEIRRYTGQDLEATTGRQEERAAPYRAIFTVQQVPVTAVTSITVAAVALDADDFVWSRWGQVHKADWTNWTEGPIVVTYDSGWASGSDEMATVKTITLEVAARALAGPTPGETYGVEVPEARGWAASVYLSDQEMARLDGLAMAMVG